MNIDYDRVLDNVLVGNRPRTQEERDYILSLGVTHIADLTSEFPVYEIACEYLKAPVIEFEPPCPRIQNIFNDFMNEANKKENSIIYIHCHHGLGRATTSLMSYLVSLGAKPELAYSDVSERRRGTSLTRAQKDFVIRSC